MDYLLEMDAISKRFPGVQALNNVTIRVQKAEIHAICGENGAGKSTLIKILSGMYPFRSYDGEVRLAGELQRFHSVRDAEKAGIICIQQELQLVPEMNVTENIYLGSEIAKLGFMRWSEMYRKTQDALQQVGLGKYDAEGRYTGVSPIEKVANLGVGRQQLVEIAKALWKKARVLILDEPTASLTDNEVDILLGILGKLRAQGVLCIYISHKIDEVMRIADTVSVLRDGQYIGTKDIKEIAKNEIIGMMVGRELKKLFPKTSHQRKEAGLEIKDFCVYRIDNPERLLISNVSFTAFKGEVLGIAGLMGSGRTELVTSIYGAYPGKKKGRVIIDGHEVLIDSPHQAIVSGIALVPEDRRRCGLVPEMNVKENITLSSLSKVMKNGVLLDEEKEIYHTNEYVSYLQIKAPKIEMKVKNLSGGNMQKVVIAKSLLTGAKVLFLDEPTRGIDVGTKYEIYKIINALVDEGVVIIVISSELEEILGLCDRALVMREGRLCGDFVVSTVDQQALMKCMQQEIEEDSVGARSR